MRKKIIICMSMLILVVVIIILTNVLKKSNKKIQIGNNNSIKEITEILNIESYKANITVKVKSNKNENEYKIYQEVKKNQYEKAKITSPEEINGVEILFENNILSIKNSKINASKIYKNYDNIGSNSLFLTDFLEEFKDKNNEQNFSKNINEYNKNLTESTNNSKENITRNIEKDANETRLIIKTNDVYSSKKKLTIDNKTMKPTKMIIQDNTQNTRVYILYNEIEFNI